VEADPAQLRSQRLWGGQDGFTQPAQKRARGCCPVRVGFVGGKVRARKGVDQAALGGLGEARVVDELTVGGRSRVV